MPIVSLLLIATASVASPADEWRNDFAAQPVEQRPALEVRYTDGSRTSFEIIAAAYHVVGSLTTPQRLVDAMNNETWIDLHIEAEDGRPFAVASSATPSRINLYRRGPYFCEVHWLDLTFTDAEKATAPIRGDLALFCYPDKLLAQLTLHATEPFELKRVVVAGKTSKTLSAVALERGKPQRFAWAVFGESATLPTSAFETIDAASPLRYDVTRGCYVIGSKNDGGFQEHYYDHPNAYSGVTFRITNDATPRTIYVCHETSDGVAGCVEGGVLLDEHSDPLPILVQISKNFGAEKEEPFYNPHDAPFGETYFPLVLGANETCTVTSLHLYQNWGQHMVKGFSSLGAWMDYFHSSTGVTETTCFVPFKYNALDGVVIADLRAMSQPTFWASQPEHDNIAGHRLLRYQTDAGWQDLVYRGTTYHSTGPNWFDVELQYRSADGCIDVTLRSFELPQADQTRNFFTLQCKVRQPLVVENARDNFRLLGITSAVQKLRYKYLAASDHPDRELDFAKDQFSPHALPLPIENGYVALYGEPKGSNAIILRRWKAALASGGANPAVSVWCNAKTRDTELMIVPNVDKLSLAAGDTIEIEGSWLAYGDARSAEPAKREAIAYGEQAPRLQDIHHGNFVRDFPLTLRASRNYAEFAMSGGRDLVPIIVDNLSDYRWPLIERQDTDGWHRIPAARMLAQDGTQANVLADGSFRGVLLVPSDDTTQFLRIRFGEPYQAAPRIAVRPIENAPGGQEHAVVIQAPWMKAPIKLRFPETLGTDALDFIDHHRADMPPRVPSPPLARIWQAGEADSLQFDWSFPQQEFGGRVTPNADDVELMLWLENDRTETVPFSVQVCPVLAGTMFEDHTLERTWIFTHGRWELMARTDRGDRRRELCHYPVIGQRPPKPVDGWGASRDVADLSIAAVTSPDGEYVFAIAWPQARTILSNALLPCVHADPVTIQCPPHRRAVLHGKVYLYKGSLDDLANRFRRELLPLAHAE